MKKLWSITKEALKCMVFLLVAVVICGIIFGPPIFISNKAGKEVVAQKFAKEQGEQYEEIAQLFVKDINEIGEKYDFSYVRVSLLKENQEDGTILFELSKTGAKYSYTNSDSDELFSLGFFILLFVIWIMVLIIIFCVISKIIEKYKKS